MKIDADHQYVMAEVLREKVPAGKGKGAPGKGIPETQGPQSGAGGDKELPGVLRLLQEGHFKGVAELRLRINFDEKLAQLGNAALVEKAPQAVEQFLAELGTKAEALMVNLDNQVAESVAPLLLDFEEKVAGLMNDGGFGTIDQLLASIRMEFEALVASLQTAISGAERGSLAADNETGAEGVTAEIPEEGAPLDGSNPSEPEGQTGGGELLVQLVQDFESALAALREELTQSSSVLPPLSPYEGNGKAYAKFLAIYNELNGISHDLSAPAPDIDNEI
jgi:hypothetical protein